MKPKQLNAKSVKVLMPFIALEYGHFINYKQSALYAQGTGFMKAAKFYEQEAVEEAQHSAKIQAFLTDWNVPIELPAIEQPEPTKYTSLYQTIEEAYKREYQLYESYEDASVEVVDTDPCVHDFLCEFRGIQTRTVAEYSDKLNLLDGTDTTDKFKMLMLEETLFT